LYGWQHFPMMVRLEDFSAMRVRIFTGGSLAAALLLGSTLVAADLKSGPQEGQKLSAFHPLHVTGKQAGEKACLV